MTIDEATAFLMGGGAPSAKFISIGDTITGRITDKPLVSQQTDFTTGELKYWKDGKPMNQLVVTVATDLRDPQIGDDDGTRRLYVKGKMQAAVRDAVRAARAPGLEVGGTLTVTYIGDDAPTQRGMNGAKLYRAEYTAAASSFLENDQHQEPASNAAAATQAAASHVASAPSGDEPPAHLAASVKAAWANLPEATKAQLRSQAS